jgi:hypothetical protein
MYQLIVGQEHRVMGHPGKPSFDPVEIELLKAAPDAEGEPGQILPTGSRRCIASRRSSGRSRHPEWHPPEILQVAFEATSGSGRVVSTHPFEGHAHAISNRHVDPPETAITTGRRATDGKHNTSPVRRWRI